MVSADNRRRICDKDDFLTDAVLHRKMYLRGKISILRFRTTLSKSFKWHHIKNIEKGPKTTAEVKHVVLSLFLAIIFQDRFSKTGGGGN